MPRLKRTSAIAALLLLGGTPIVERPLEVRAQVPEVQLATAEEILADVRERTAQVTVVNFWATWCVPCREEFPEFVQLGKDLASQGVDVIFVSADFEEALPQAQVFLAEQGVRPPPTLSREKTMPL